MPRKSKKGRKSFKAKMKRKTMKTVGIVRLSDVPAKITTAFIYDKMCEVSIPDKIIYDNINNKSKYNTILCVYFDKSEANKFKKLKTISLNNKTINVDIIAETRQFIDLKGQTSHVRIDNINAKNVGDINEFKSYLENNGKCKINQIRFYKYYGIIKCGSNDDATHLMEELFMKDYNNIKLYMSYSNEKLYDSRNMNLEGKTRIIEFRNVGPQVQWWELQKICSKWLNIKQDNICKVGMKEKGHINREWRVKFASNDIAKLAFEQLNGTVIKGYAVETCYVTKLGNDEPKTSNVVNLKKNLKKMKIKKVKIVGMKRDKKHNKLVKKLTSKLKDIQMKYMKPH